MRLTRVLRQRVVQREFLAGLQPMTQHMKPVIEHIQKRGKRAIVVAQAVAHPFEERLRQWPEFARNAIVRCPDLDHAATIVHTGRTRRTKRPRHTVRTDFPKRPRRSRNRLAARHFLARKSRRQVRAKAQMLRKALPPRVRAGRAAIAHAQQPDQLEYVDASGCAENQLFYRSG
ncbi:hypothetical protein LMG29739_06097 [Paraburkholderia solisilvae]|uniref:Uncharacterized protein n=1 Tax=Paraburkholderia solisilvae TaxID=624376 RepID=A0A6J5F2Z9_9BURK|nr:hypothetical protein LMG29739_06097 [Paraburkholderia solisilvae]